MQSAETPRLARVNRVGEQNRTDREPSKEGNRLLGLTLLRLPPSRIRIGSVWQTADAITTMRAFETIYIRVSGVITNLRNICILNLRRIELKMIHRECERGKTNANEQPTAEK